MISPEHNEGMRTGSWSEAWAETRSRLLHVAHPVKDVGWQRYWDRRSGGYMAQLTGDEPLRDAVVGFMAREGLLAPGDDVLDVGCGPGPYSLLFAKIARTVTGLDISQGMLDEMAGRAAAAGIGNVRPACSSWQSYRGRKKYDLVFSSFCPGVESPEALLKMERLCRRTCCYATGGGTAQPAYMRELWEMLTGEQAPPPEEDRFFAFNALYEAGRMPSVRAFRFTSIRATPVDEIARNALMYFDLLIGLDAGQKQAVKDYFESSQPGEAEACETDRSLFLVYWQP